GSSSLAALRINGTRISLDDPLSDLADALAGTPLAGLVTLAINEEIRTGVSSGPTESLTRRALRVRVQPSATGSQLLEAVAGESIVGRSGAVCSGDGGGGGGGGGGGPIGGNLVTLGEVRGAGPCRRHRYGRQVAIVGSRRGDRISGTNRSDRIFVFSGNDRVSGGRGNDCVEGGNGNDRLDGSTGFDFLLGERGNDSLAGGPGRDLLEGGSGRDRLDGGTGSDIIRGGSGNDRLIGGSGNDRLYGGSGNDSIHTGNGRDRVFAGNGNDVINAATAGPPARINCGRGFDVVRINHNERRHIRGCERVFIISLRR
ncbi:MAG TPA: calcium-binding protein, partial [Thermoleophilaceae bacterium]|nr:calcium-binding protein [Thermoleophilaceae bacterium]